MKKIAILALALVMAVGSLGVGFAHWGGTFDISGTVYMADLCVGWYYIDATGGDPEAPAGGANADWVKNLDTGLVTQAAQDVGWTEAYFSGQPVCSCAVPDWPITGDTTPDPHYQTLTIVVHNAYPGYYVDYEVHYHNCGLPVKILSATPDFDPALDYTFTDGIGDKLETCETAASSIEVWCKQPTSPTAIDGVQPGQTYYFTLTIAFEQWQ